MLHVLLIHGLAHSGTTIVGKTLKEAHKACWVGRSFFHEAQWCQDVYPAWRPRDGPLNARSCLNHTAWARATSPKKKRDAINKLNRERAIADRKARIEAATRRQQESRSKVSKKELESKSATLTPAAPGKRGGAKYTVHREEPVTLPSGDIHRPALAFLLQFQSGCIPYCFYYVNW